MMINGYRIIVSQPMPKMRLAENVPVTQEFRDEINIWMAGFFGYQEPLAKRGQVHVMEREKMMIAHPEDYRKLQEMT